MKFSACPLDCYDACGITYENGKIKPSRDLITNGKLCLAFGYMQNEKTLQDKDLQNTLQKVVDKLKEPNKKILYYKGYGNMGVLQNTPKLFFEKIKATVAVGSICDEAGEAGLKLGRGNSVNPDIADLLKSEVIIVWGRSFTTSSSHIYNLVKDKTFITIDPVKNKIANLSKLHLQITPKGDYILAQELMNKLDNKDINYEKLSTINISKEEFIELFETLTTKKISIMLGIGAQKYKQGAQIFHKMDSLFNKLGLFTNGNKHVWYIGDSRYRFDNPFNRTLTNTCGYADVKFDDYDIVFIQAANPVITAMDTNKIKQQLKNTFVIVMGTRDDETIKYADIVIPAKTYLQKRDIRLGYSHDEIRECEVCQETNEAISEYELTQYLYDAFGFDDLVVEDELLQFHRDIKRQKPSSIDFKEHNFDEVGIMSLKENEFYLLTSKQDGNINSQFKIDDNLYIHPSFGFEDGDILQIDSSVGKIQLPVVNDDSVHKNAILVYSGNKKINQIIPKIVSDYGANGSYQDFTVCIQRV